MTASQPSSRPDGVTGTARVVIAGLVGLAVLHLLLYFPRRPLDQGLDPLIGVPLEPLILLGLAGLIPILRGRAVRLAVWLGAALTMWVGAADLLSYMAFNRPADLLVDWRYLPHLVELMAGALGWPLALAYAGGAVLAFVAGLWAAWWALGAVQRLSTRRTAAILGGMTGLAAVAMAVAWSPGQRPAPVLVAGEPLVRQVDYAIAGAEAFANYSNAAGTDRVRALPAGSILPDLAGVDVLFVFVESYGRSALEDPRYSSLVMPVLDNGAGALADAGLASASGWLTSPVQGGLSWLAHGSVLSGQWIDRERAYELMLAAGHPTLVEDFERAGHRTAVVMPAITRAWPQADAFGYQARYFHDNLGYAGDPFNWVTMPDQYTLSALDRLELNRPDRPPVMAEVALISSHAPWTPVPELIDWDLVGDGVVFNRWANSGDPPAVVWRDIERIRDQYRLAVAYSMETVLSYAARLDRPTLLVVLGDHQPAPLITGPEASRDVPVHILATDAALVAPWLEADFADGLVPPPGGDALRMDGFRPLFHRLYGTGGDEAGPVTTARALAH